MTSFCGYCDEPIETADRRGYEWQHVDPAADQDHAPLVPELVA